MARLHFTPQLRRFTDVADLDLPATTLAELLEQAFERFPRLRGYVLDEQRHVRPHVIVFVDGGRCHDRQNWSQPLNPDSTVHVLQALTGG
jgi:sulfur-carrier protein